MNIDYHNMPEGSSKTAFVLRYLINTLRTWYLFHFKYPWVKHNGFVRVMKGTAFAKGMKISLGHNVQFGNYCNVSADVQIGNNVLCAGRVCFVGKNDHTYNIPGQTIWDGARGNNGFTIIGDDVWLGHNVTIVGPVTIGHGVIVAAGAVVTKDIPDCEVWGGVPAKKITNRFCSENDKKRHIDFLSKKFDK